MTSSYKTKESSTNQFDLFPQSSSAVLGVRWGVGEAASAQCAMCAFICCTDVPKWNTCPDYHVTQKCMLMRTVEKQGPRAPSINPQWFQFERSGRAELFLFQDAFNLNEKCFATCSARSSKGMVTNIQTL